MTTRARWLVALAALLMATAYVLPLWRVELIAPQYPEGLGMYITINGVDGFKENDLANINNLNHYIGMKAIEPDAIPELRYMPWILAGLIAGGLAVAAAARRRALTVFGVVLGLVLSAGLFDYWRWGYDYGHDLDHENAIIKIPGMTYQPPLIGSKKLLNFRATSWPAPGGVALTLAAVLVAAAMFDSRRRSGSRHPALGGVGTVPPVAAVLALLAAGCGGAAPRAISLGEDQCNYCRMEITEARFGTQVILGTGKTVVFDSVECLAGFVNGNTSAIRSTWVADAAVPEGRWVPVEQAGFLRDSALRGPMGQVIAFATPADAERERARLGGETLSWAAILADSAGVLAHAGH